MAAIGPDCHRQSILIVHVVGIVSSRSSSSYFDATATTHLSPTMSLPGQRSITTNSAKRLPSRWLQCRRGCSSSPCQVSRDMLPYVFLRRTQLTTTPQRPSTRRDQNCRQRPPWCPTPNADAHNGHPVCWLIVVCGGAGSGAPWQPWDDVNRQGWRGMLLLALASFYLAKAQHHNTQQSIDKAPPPLRAR
jgi:hypothetical protein